MNRLLLFLLAIPLFYSAQTDSKGKDKGGVSAVFKNAEDAGKMILARQKLYGGEFVSALNLYREVEKNNPGDGTVLYYVGLCYYNLKEMGKAREHLLKALESTTNFKPETHLTLGKVYQAEGDYDKAIDQFTKYKGAPGKDKEDLQDADLFLSQCQNAKEYMNKPLPVSVTNLGDKVNSKYDDKNPCITADGTKLVFTSRRPKGADAPVDAEGDGKYFEDVYLAPLDSASKSFNNAMEVPGAINTKGAHDAVTGISADGKLIFIYKNDMSSKEARGGDVFISKIMNTGKWKAPEPIGKPVSSSYWEGGACISPDGKKYFFTSERPGGLGGSDIWMVEKINKKEWGKPVNLGEPVNSKYDEGGIFLAPDGKTLFFCSNGPRSMGGYDVFRSVFSNGKWSAPVNLGYPINSGAKEGQLAISADASKAYISSDRPGGLGESDVYMVELKDYDILEPDGAKKAGNKLSILKGVIREGNEGYGLADVEVNVTDDTGNAVGAASTNENGEYFFMLKGGSYNLSVKKKGYKDISEKVDVPLSEKETAIVEKGYLLKK